MLKRVTTRIRCSPEYAAFQECYPDILTAIQSPEHLANVLFAKNVIDNEVKAQVHLDPQTIMKKGSILLDAVEQAIRADPDSFHVHVYKGTIPREYKWSADSLLKAEKSI